MVAGARARGRAKMIRPDLVRQAIAQAGGLVNQTEAGALLGRSKSVVSWLSHRPSFPKPIYEGTERLWLYDEIVAWGERNPAKGATR